MIYPSSLKTSPFITAVKHYEGFFAKPYRCPAGVWTIGYGHTKGINQNTAAITEQEATAILGDDLMEAGQDVLNLTKGCLVANDGDAKALFRFEALASFVFNLGAGAFASSTLLKRLKEQRFEDAAREILRWNKATVNGKKTVLRGLTRRRQCESHYFLTGQINLF